MNRKNFFRSLLGVSAVPVLSPAEEQAEALDSVRLVMREEIDRMMNAPIVQTDTQSKRYGPDGELEWVGEYSDDGTALRVHWRPPYEGEE